MNLFLLQNDVNKAIKWSKENRLEFNMVKFEAICFDVKKLDQCSVHLYADDSEITCKSSVNDLGIIIINKLKWDSQINQRLSKAQKRNVPFFTDTRVKVSLYKIYILSINSPVRVKCMVLELAKLQKTRKDAKTSAQVGFE